MTNEKNAALPQAQTLSGEQAGTSRRQFLGAVTAAGVLSTWTARSYASIVGANDRVNFAVIGLNSRAYAHLSALQANRKDARITHVCDVDSTILAKFADKTKSAMNEPAQADKDFRRTLEAKDVDAITIATPDHWHTPMAILGLQAGKAVYVEKPCSYDPHEGLMLIEAVKKTGKVCQMGSQQRSSPHTIEIVNKIHNGLIGRAYWAETWYANRRKPIGVGKEIPVPATLDWDLWQGPAPRTAYKDNVHPYNWHWFKRWGTGETLNNGTHEIDVARWALDVAYPTHLVATGGRYAAKDDWQFYDTLDVAINYPDKLLTWKCDCCSGKTTYGSRSRCSRSRHHRYRHRRSRGLRGLRPQGQKDRRIHRQRARCYLRLRPGRRRQHDRYALRQHDRRHPHRRRAPPAHHPGQRRRHPYATLQYLVLHRPRSPDRSRNRRH